MMGDDMIDTDAIGPVDVAVLGFTGDARHGQVAEAILELVDAGIVRVIDLAYVAKDHDGGIDILEVVDSELADALAQLDPDLDLLNDDDLLEIGDRLEPGTGALVAVWENTWAARLGAAVRSAGGQVIDHVRIPRDVVVAALDALRDAQEAQQ
jgi:uncharacterized membrane protein